MKNIKIQIYVILSLAVIFIAINSFFLVQDLIYPAFIEGKQVYTDYTPYIMGTENFLEDPMKLYYRPPEIPEGCNYLYPPPSVLLFIPYNIFSFNFGQFLFFITGIISFLISFWLIVDILKMKYNVRFNKKTLWILLIYVLAIAPFFQNLRVVQINTIVLMLCVLSYYLFEKDRFFFSGIILSMAIWLKLYPFLLFILFFRSKQSFINGFAGLFIGIIIIPLLLSPVIPIDLYVYYFTEYMPGISNMPHTVAPMNQSLMSFIMMFQIQPETYVEWNPQHFSELLRIINYGFLFLFSVFSMVLYLKKNLPAILTFSILLILPVMTSATGWEHTYSLILPFLIVFYFLQTNDKPFVSYFISLCLLLFLIPKPPDSLILKFSDEIPQFIQVLFYSRFLIVSFILILMSFFSQIKIKNSSVYI